MNVGDKATVIVDGYPSRITTVERVGAREIRTANEGSGLTMRWLRRNGHAVDSIGVVLRAYSHGDDAEVGVYPLRQDRKALAANRDRFEQWATVHRREADRARADAAVLDKAAAEEEEKARALAGQIADIDAKIEAIRAKAAAPTCPCESEADEPGSHIEECLWNNPNLGGTPT